MFRFEHPEYLYAFILVPLLLVVLWWAYASWRRRMGLFGRPGQLERLLQGRQRARSHWRIALWFLAFASLIFAGANPQWGTKREVLNSQGVDLFIALDLSQSMLAEDLAPNRLERARRFAGELALRLRGNKTGLIVFAGSAYLQAPLTMDYAAIALLLKSAHPSMISDQGTVFSDVFRLANRSFPADAKAGKALILISDGEAHEEDALRELRTGDAKDLTVFVVGVGTSEGSFIPVSVAGQRDYKRDESGAPVRSRLDEEVLKAIAAEGKGAYFNLNAGAGPIVEALAAQIERLEKRELEQRIFSEYESYFQLLIGLAFVLLLLEWALLGRKRQEL